MTVTAQDQVVARIDGQPLLLSEVAARVVSLRTGRMAAVLPAANTAEGRNLQRWVVQLCAAERLVGTAVAEPGRRSGRLAVSEALQVGGVAAAILHRVPAAIELVPPVPVPEAAVRDYFDRNRDLYPQSYDQVRAQLASELADHARITAFGRWLDRAMHERVRLEPGFEHPGEPGHPDSTHRH